YQARLRARYGRAWRRKAPVESLMPLRLARYGVPLSDTAPAGLAAAGLEPSAVPAPALPSGQEGKAGPHGVTGALTEVNDTPTVADTPPQQLQRQNQQTQGQATQHEQQQQQHPQPSQLTVPAGSGRRVRPLDASPPTIPTGPDDWATPLGGEGAGGDQGTYVPQQREPEQHAHGKQPGQALNQLPHDVPHEEAYYAAFRQFLTDHSHYPSAYQFGQQLRETYGLTNLSNSELTAYIGNFKERLLVGAGHSRSDWHGMNGHDHHMAIPEQRGQPRTGYEEKPGRGHPELSQPRRHDPAGDALPARHHTSGDATSAPQIETDTEPPAPPPEEQGTDASPGPPLEPPKKPEPEQKTDEQPPTVETVADRYYTAWRAYREKHGIPPNGDQLSRWLYDQGVTGRNGKAVSPSTLRRYIASYPCYETWAEHADSHGHEPTGEELVKLLANHGIKRNNGGLPWELTDLEHLLPHFQKRHRLRSPS
ncbi:hypothetical protein ACIO1D_43265, partial [Streptomyces antimycoticus]